VTSSYSSGSSIDSASEKNPDERVFIPTQLLFPIVQLECLRSGSGEQRACGEGTCWSHVPGPIVRDLFSLYRDLLGATGVGWHVDLFTSVCIDDLERGGRIIQPHRFDLGIDREGVSDG
jgi:hypothetical protein